MQDSDAGIFRNKLASEGNFTTVSNSWIRSSGLTPQANFLWIYLLSHKVGYELRDTQILNETGFGPKGLRSARKELVDAGWLKLQRKKNSDGSLGSYSYFLQEPRVPQGTVEQSTVEEGTVPEGPDLRILITKNTNTKKTRTKRELHPIPEDWKANESFYEDVKWTGLDIDDEAERFVNWHQAKGIENKDWQAAFRNWLKKAIDYRKKTDYRESELERFRREWREAGLPEMEDE